MVRSVPIVVASHISGCDEDVELEGDGPDAASVGEISCSLGSSMVSIVNITSRKENDDLRLEVAFGVDSVSPVPRICALEALGIVIPGASPGWQTLASFTDSL